MSGIFGLIDPAGPDIRALAAAASRESWRGTPVVRSDGPVALGCYTSDADMVVTPDSMTVADARIDALTRGALDGVGDVALLDRVMGQADGLDDVVGDFAVARYERTSRTLTLSRDAGGMRGLYWARSGSRVAFASDASVLVNLGLASGAIDREAVIDFLAYRNPPRYASGIEGIRRVAGGESLSFDASGTERSVRWFRPEQATEERRTAREFADALKSALVEAVTACSRGRRVGLLLSAGRDSTSVAVALALAGIRATCITFLYPPEFGCREAHARDLARDLGHDWLGIEARLVVNADELLEAARTRSSPLDVSLHQHALLLRRAVAESGADVLLDGMGGEPLFVAAPVAVGELARAGRLRLAAAAARGYHNEWTYPYGVQLKAAIRGALPPWVLRIRERVRRTPAWVVGTGPGSLDPATAPRRAKDRLLSSLDEFGCVANHNELIGGPIVRAGAERASPLMDKRIVSLALTLPLELRVPVPGPKPLLALAFLGSLDADRTKADFAALYAHWARVIGEALPSWFGSDGKTARLGLVDASRPRSYGEGAESGAVLAWTAVEAWLRAHSDGGG